MRILQEKPIIGSSFNVKIPWKEILIQKISLDIRLIQQDKEFSLKKNFTLIMKYFMFP